MVYMWKSEGNLWSWFFPPTIWFPELELRLSGLAAGAITYLAIMLASKAF